MKEVIPNKPITGKRVLVIGGTRFMGVELVKELIRLKNEVTIANRGRRKDPFGDEVNRVTLDVAKPETVKKALEDKEFDIVFDNLAYCSNYVRNLLSVVKCKKYIQLSSIRIYDYHLELKEEEFNPLSYEQKWNTQEAGYNEGKRQAECAAYQVFSNIPTVTVRVPPVIPTDRILFYCESILNEAPMQVVDLDYACPFVRHTEVGTFLPWLAAQDHLGPINIASTGYITVRELIAYIEEKTNKKAIIDSVNGTPSPFDLPSASMSMEKAESLGYKSSKLADWIWKYVDRCIDIAKKNKQANQSKPRLSIFGSPVFADYMGDDYVIDKYASCSSIMSVMDDKKNKKGDNFTYSVYPELTSFAKRCASIDAHASTFEYLSQRKSNYLILDMSEAKTPIAYFSDYATTYSNAIKNSQEYLEGKYGKIEIKQPYEFTDAEWERATLKFCKKMLEAYDEHEIIVNEFYACTEYADKTRVGLHSFTDDDIKKIEKINHVLSVIYSTCKKSIPNAYFIKQPENLFADANHKWGLGSMNYHFYYYDYVKSAVSSIVEFNKKNVARDCVTNHLNVLHSLYSQKLLNAVMTLKSRVADADARRNDELCRLSTEAILNYDDVLNHSKEFFEARGIKSVGIWGAFTCSEVLLAILKKIGIRVDYVVSSNKSCQLARVVSPRAELPNTDAIIICDTNYIEPVKKDLKSRVSFPAYSINEVLFK